MLISKWRFLVVIGVILTGFAYVLPTFLSKDQRLKWPQWLPQETMHLGLDLKGGSSILLEVDVQGALQERLQSLKNEIRSLLRKEHIGYTHLGVHQNVIRLTLRDPSRREKVYMVLRKFGSDVVIDTTGDGQVQVRLSDVGRADREKMVVEQSIEIVRRRIDEMGTKEPLIQRQGTDRIVVQLPGVESPEEAKALIGKTAKLSLHLPADEGAINVLELAQEITQGDRTQTYKHVLHKEPILTGEMLTDARAATSPETGEWVVSFALDGVGARKFGDVTSKNVGKPMAIVLDGRVISAPRISTPIMGGSGQITGRFTAKEANDLAILLRAGALPAPLVVLEERTVGPDLGADSIEAGKKATILACILVFVFMFVVYGLVYGSVANLALFVNLLLLIASLIFLGATLTLPGIAGIALTLGMAVDANVLIFERIKEELRAGKKIASSIEGGFHRAMGTILDSNVTTIIGAALLYQFGTGSVRGFAVTLTFGILISMFTAITVTRFLLTLVYKWFGPKVLSFGIKSSAEQEARS